MNTRILPPELEGVKALLRSALDAQGELSTDFDLDQWLQEWLLRPQPALGGKRPADYAGRH